MAASWVIRRSSHLQFPSILFNGISNCLPVTVQPTTPSGLSQVLPLSFPGAQPQPLAQILTQTHLLSSLPIQPPSSQPQVRISGVSCPTSQNKSQSLIPTEIQHVEWPLLWKQQKSERTLPFAAKRSQEVFSQLTPNLPQDNRASHSQRSVSIPHREFISPNLQKQHLQRRLLKDEHQDGRCFRIQVSLELRLRANSQGCVRHRTSRGPCSPLCLQVKAARGRRLTFQRGKEFSRGLQQCLKRILKDTLEVQPASQGRQ